MIRLSCYTTAALAPLTPPQGENPLSCVLHTGVLEAHQFLTVWVGGVGVPLIPDGEQQVCTWQCAPEVEIEIRLRQHSSQMKAWRGWWRDGTLVRAGTLPVQVMVDGQVQVQPEATTVPLLPGAGVPLLASASLDQRNGTSALHAPSPGSAPATTVLERPAPRTEPPPVPDGAAPAAPEGDLWEVELAAQRQAAEEAQGTPVQEPPGEAEPGAETEAAPVAVPPLPQESAQQEPAQVEGAGEAEERVTAPLIATMGVRSPVSLAQQEDMLQQLARIVESMPPNTILVDLRQHPRSARVHPSRRASARPGGAWGLSKELLRGRYGARYWERGDSIPTRMQQVSTHPSRWNLVISDSHAPGLQELLTQLARGGSLVILDGEGSYAISKRAAVIDFVRLHCPQVTIGTCV